MKKAGGEEEGGNFFGETPTSPSFYFSKRGRQDFSAGPRSLTPDPLSALANRAHARLTSASVAISCAPYAQQTAH
jgi:hypothetical protein